ncbi:hypothetical protein N7535_003943 [Penicillium sp. DV-2018c]|nr:hypothetical protein N7461_000356 [Penicillium sp. DV-2018c]KAJ5577017.1 hypothetical protein N7535_003943 [Penicillium sp. DV-2018c]
MESRSTAAEILRKLSRSCRALWIHLFRVDAQPPNFRRQVGSVVPNFKEQTRTAETALEFRVTEAAMSSRHVYRPAYQGYLPVPALQRQGGQES